MPQASGGGACSLLSRLVLPLAFLGACAGAPGSTVPTVSTDAPAAPPSTSAAPSDPAAPGPTTAASAPATDPSGKSANRDTRSRLAELDAAMLEVLTTGGGDNGGLLTGTLTGATPPDTSVLSGPGIGGSGAGGGGRVTAGSSTKVSAPSAAVAVGTVQVTGGSITGAASVAAGMAPGFRRCIQVSVLRDPTSVQTGARIVLRARIDEEGGVTLVNTTSISGIPTDAEKCMSQRVSSAHFAPPDSVPSMIEIPVTVQVQP